MQRTCSYNTKPSVAFIYVSRKEVTPRKLEGEDCSVTASITEEYTTTKRTTP